MPRKKLSFGELGRVNCDHASLGRYLLLVVRKIDDLRVTVVIAFLWVLNGEIIGGLLWVQCG